MDLKKLRAFGVVAEFKSFSKAAVHLSVSQSLLSKQIGELESELSVRLFYRNGRGALLTAEGEKLLVYARRLDVLVEETVSAVKGLKSKPSGTVIIGTSSAIGATLTVPLIQQARERYPLISLNIVEALSGHVHEWLNTGRIDIAVVFDTTRKTALLHEDLIDEDLMLVSPPGYPVGASIDFPGNQLHTLPFVLPSRAHKLRVLIDSYLGPTSSRLNVVAEVDALVPMIQGVKSGLGHAILPYGAVVHEAEAGRVRLSRIVAPPLRRTVFMATSAERIPTTASRAMSGLIREVAQRLDAAGCWQPTDAALRGLRDAA